MYAQSYKPGCPNTAWLEAYIKKNKKILHIIVLLQYFKCNEINNLFLILIYSVSCGLSAAPAPVGNGDYRDRNRHRPALNGLNRHKNGTRPAQTGTDRPCRTGQAQDRHRPARFVLWRFWYSFCIKYPKKAWYLENSYQKRHKTVPVLCRSGPVGAGAGRCRSVPLPLTDRKKRCSGLYRILY